jgi:acyl-CoA reductase-like NAD-dependent aldehyde dehydrogenase
MLKTPILYRLSRLFVILQAELAKAEEGMAAAQRASQDANLPDDERDGVLRRIQELTDREADALQRLNGERQVRHRR